MFFFLNDINHGRAILRVIVFSASIGLGQLTDFILIVAQNSLAAIRQLLPIGQSSQRLTINDLRLSFERYYFYSPSFFVDQVLWKDLGDFKEQISVTGSGFSGKTKPTSSLS